MRIVVNGAALLIAVFLPINVACAGQDWHDVKCERYKNAWSQAVDHFGTQGLSRSFLDQHAAFLASNCTRRADVCARSPEELRLANTMVVLAMNAGTASTFPPFYCRL